MDIVVAIVGFRNAAEVASCLEALSASTYPSFEVVICENGGDDAYRALIAATGAALPTGQPVTCLNAADNPGYAGGVNACIRARPNADAWWVVNPDTRPEPDALAMLVERLAQGDCDAVGGTLYHPDGRVQAYGGWWRGWLARPHSIGHGALLDAPVDVAAVERQMNYILGASMLVSRRLVDQAGLMRDDYFLYCEEVEWFVRASARGLKLGFEPRSRVCHGQGGTTGSADALHLRPRLPIYCDERNKIHVVRDTTPARLPVAAASALVLTFLRYGRRGAWRQWGYALSGWFDGLRGRRGKPAWLTRR